MSIPVLVACEHTGTVRDALRARGIDAVSCDLLPCEGDPQWHIQDDVRNHLQPGRWAAMIAHPDCTYLTTSAEWAYRDHQTKNLSPNKLYGAPRRRARERALAFVDDLWRAGIKHVALENPQGVINTRLSYMPKPQYIQPYQFGEDASKRTGLWLRNLPPLVPTSYVEPRWICCQHVLDVKKLGKRGCPHCHGANKPLPRWANQTDSGQNRLPPSADRWKQRSATYFGIANAMGDQWGRYLKHVFQE